MEKKAKCYQVTNTFELLSCIYFYLVIDYKTFLKQKTYANLVEKKCECREKKEMHQN